MSEMVERVARALCRQYEIDDGFSPQQADRAAASEMYRNFCGAARAAIEAMREPTREMIEAEPEEEPDGRGGYWNKTNSAAHAKAFWQAIIDEALK